MALRDHEEGDAEGYFASVSDLMVGILFVFLLMLSVFALNYRVAEHDQEVSRARFDIEKARADRVRELLEKAAAQLQQDIAASSTARDRLLATLETNLSQRGIQVWVDRQAGILHLPGDLLFETLSATLGPRQRDSVGIPANALARILPCLPRSPIEPTAIRLTCPSWRRFWSKAIPIAGRSEWLEPAFATMTSSPPKGPWRSSPSFAARSLTSTRCGTPTGAIRCSEFPASVIDGRCRKRWAAPRPTTASTGASICVFYWPAPLSWNGCAVSSKRLSRRARNDCPGRRGGGDRRRDLPGRLPGSAQARRRDLPDPQDRRRLTSPQSRTRPSLRACGEETA